MELHLRIDDKKKNGSSPCAYPEAVAVPSIKDIDDDLGFKDNSAHAIHRENKSKNKGISPTHD